MLYVVRGVKQVHGERCGAFHICVVIGSPERVMQTSYVIGDDAGTPLTQTFWCALPDDNVRGCNELFVWDAEG